MPKNTYAKFGVCKKKIRNLRILASMIQMGIGGQVVRMQVSSYTDPFKAY